MSTRAGDIDPGLAWYLMECEKLSPEEYKNMVNHASGLLGISGTTGDMQKLLEAEATDAKAAEAVEFFCYHVRKYIGAYTAVLQGLDVLVFSGGIGQHAPQLRAAICGPLKYLGVQLDYEKNNDNELLVSAANSSVAVCVIPTDEEHIMAEMALALLTDTHKN
jgi:acetate kinase